MSMQDLVSACIICMEIRGHDDNYNDERESMQSFSASGPCLSLQAGHKFRVCVCVSLSLSLSLSQCVCERERVCVCVCVWGRGHPQAQHDCNTKCENVHILITIVTPMRLGRWPEIINLFNAKNFAFMVQIHPKIVWKRLSWPRMLLFRTFARSRTLRRKLYNTL